MNKQLNIFTVRQIFAAIILSVICSSLLAANNSPDETFAEAVSFYDERNYEEALDNFLEIEHINSAEVYYNIGNCHYRLNNIGKAILYYKRGLRVNPADYQLNANLNYALNRTKDRQTQDELNPLFETITKTVHSISLNGWLITTLLSFAIVIVILNIIIIYYRGKEKLIPLFLLTIFLFVFLLSSGITYYRVKSYYDTSEAVLISSSTNGYSGPATDYTRLFSINEGMVFNVLNKDVEWSQIRLPNGMIGWIKNSSFETVGNY